MKPPLGGDSVGRKAVVLLIISLLCLGPIAPLGGSDEGGTDRGIELYGEDYPVWTDPLDDLSHVYVPPGGLVGVEVVGGEVRLESGHDMGWIASSVIVSPAGMRCDLVILDAIRPGNSSIEISLLNALEESVVIGYANETIPSYVNIEATALSIQHISPSDYPEVRIQVNLQADGTDRPRLMGWSMHFAQLDEWREESGSAEH